MLKKLALSCMIGAALLSVAGCGSDQDAASSDKKITIGFSVSTQNNPFFVKMADSVKAEAAKQGVDVKIVDAQNDPAKQANDVSDLIEQGVNVLIVNPVDSAAIGNSVVAANDAKIPVITIDRSSDSGEVVTHIASNNIKGGEMAADFLVQKLGEGAEVAELEGIPGASATRERGQGFHNIADKKLKVVAKQNADFDRSKGLTVAENMLQAKPNIKAVIAQNDEMDLGAIRAAKSAGKSSLVIGFDGTEDGVKAVNSGDMIATIAQQPDQMGVIGVDTALKLVKSEKVEKSIPIDLKLVTKQ